MMEIGRGEEGVAGSQDIGARVFSGEESRPLLLIYIPPNNNQNKNVNRKTSISV